ncbi:DUF6192 family protein [Streptomyces subrutilus]
MNETADKIGSVSARRYEQIVAELRKIIGAQTRGQFAIGDYALEIEPMREQGPQDRGEELFTVKESLFRLAEDIGLSYSAVNGARWVASRWPKQHRQARVSFTVHRILAAISNEEERFTAILTPPGGKARWFPDDASRRVGRQVERPITPQEKVSAIHTLARDEEVAAVITGDLLRRPSVIAQVRQEDRISAAHVLVEDAPREHTRDWMRSQAQPPTPALLSCLAREQAPSAWYSDPVAPSEGDVVRALERVSAMVPAGVGPCEGCGEPEQQDSTDDA